MFYCTFDDNPQAQWARHAISDDLIHWEDIPEDKFGPDGVIYRMSDWRDPHVVWNEEEQLWYMLLAARENTVTERNGCVALCVSTDLHHWNIVNRCMHPDTARAPTNVRICLKSTTGTICLTQTIAMASAPIIV